MTGQRALRKMRDVIALPAGLKPGETATAHGITVDCLADGGLRWSAVRSSPDAITSKPERGMISLPK